MADGDSSETSSLAAKRKNTSEGQRISVTNKNSDSGLEYSEGDNSDSDELLTPKVKSTQDRQSLGLVGRGEKGRSLTSQNKSNLPFNVQKLRTVLDGAQTVDHYLSSMSPSKTEDSVLVKETSDWGKDDQPRNVDVGSSEKKGDDKSVKVKKLSLAERMKEQLNSARFRYLNEQLYKTTGGEAYKMMSSDPQAFKVYHEGFQNQVSKWPENPVKRVINYVKKRPKNLVIADFGCGDAKIARSVPNSVHSFDLVAVNEYVTACDMSKVPLKSHSVDVSVFCLSLMGTNLTEFILEANRVLKTGGTLLVAEVKSRFDKIGGFLKKLEKLGFTIKQRDLSNKMFIWLEFTKTEDCDRANAPTIELLPCVYKRR